MSLLLPSSREHGPGRPDLRPPLSLLRPDRRLHDLAQLAEVDRVAAAGRCERDQPDCDHERLAQARRQITRDPQIVFPHLVVETFCQRSGSLSVSALNAREKSDSTIMLPHV